MHNVSAVVECVLPYHDSEWFVKMVKLLELKYVVAHCRFCAPAPAPTPTTHSYAPPILVPLWNHVVLSA